MIKIFGSAACPTCKKVEQWLIDNGLEFEAVEVYGTTLTEEDADLLLDLSSGNVDLIIAEWCEEFQRLNLATADLFREEAKKILCQHPAVLRRPITVFDDIIIIGLDEVLLNSVLYEWNG